MYYYLAASLPMLAPETEPGITFDQFRALCAEHLCARHLAVLDELDEPLSARGSYPFVRRWRHRETQLRNAVARARAARANRDAAPYLREHAGFDTYAEQAATAAFARANPLERERELDRFRWSVIEEVQGHNPFSLDGLLGYALKLKLVRRWTQLNDEHGRQRVDQLVAGQEETR